MTIFDDREQQFEKQFAHSAELQFKVMARRNKLLGQWAAEQLRKTPEQTAEYVRDVIASDFERPGDDDVLEKVHADLAAAGIGLNPEAVRAEMTRLYTVARQQLAQEMHTDAEG